ncbi:LOW QUALITY PROTEIN: conserved hypothetical protein, partial [Streptomyces griseoflavus Tu4000]
ARPRGPVRGRAAAAESAQDRTAGSPRRTPAARRGPGTRARPSTDRARSRSTDCPEPVRQVASRGYATAPPHPHRPTSLQGNRLLAPGAPACAHGRGVMVHGRTARHTDLPARPGMAVRLPPGRHEPRLVRPRGGQGEPARRGGPRPSRGGRPHRAGTVPDRPGLGRTAPGPHPRRAGTSCLHPDDDLAPNRPGEALLVALDRDPAPPRRLRHDPRRRALMAERTVGEALDRMDGAGRHVLHSIPLPGGDRVHHLLIGPGGLYAVHALYAHRQRVT